MIQVAEAEGRRVAARRRIPYSTVMGKRHHDEEEGETGLEPGADRSWGIHHRDAGTEQTAKGASII